MARRRSAWVVAAWPGMAAVGQIATAYLRDRLRMEPLAEFGANGFFAPESIRVEKGFVLPDKRPRSILSLWSGAPIGRDLVLIQGEQQPSFDTMRYARSLLDACSSREIERVVTFAALATAMDPRDEARVFAACTTDELLDMAMMTPGVSRLEDAEVSGMNGEFLAAARERGIPAMCLLGEVPFYATSVPNPKASAAVLSVLRSMSGIDLQLDGLIDQARRIEGWIVRQLEGSATSRSDNEAKQGAADSLPALRHESTKAEDLVAHAEVLQHIEAMFDLAQQDRAKASDLKAELDRHGLFSQYEDRFLDLFKKAS
jgi:uncharacterized protein